MRGIGRRLIGRVLAGGGPIGVAAAGVGRDGAAAADAVEPVLPLFEFLVRDGGARNRDVAALLLENVVNELPQAGVLEVKVPTVFAEFVEFALEAVLVGVALNVADQPRQAAVLEHFLQAAELLRLAQPLGEELG